ncbi:outer membrane protein assembly factor BamB family protein [Actinoplanes aureus]|uniref:PQQ-binding-like beta-propeller repeat protein n=1 Tax=Actinoplanes aureus TaxID=2792083 RepID=A0A931CGE6_9ACTN|nr:PQQ-binding-like beta-propeller repeat protein [Actinoplanes aureus]MBG0566783.1 PQQ-binding-like beta-propeller repeat protein [Actinoplanes aureus]
MAEKGGDMAVPGNGDSGTGGGETQPTPPDQGDRTERLTTEPGYAHPVDPWAAAEAAAIAAGGHVPYHLADPNSPAHPNSTWTIPGSPEAPQRAHRAYRKGIWAACAAGAVALGVAAAVIFWPGYPALDFHALDQEKRYDALVPISSSWSNAEVSGDRIYYASSDSDGRLGVVAVDTESRKEAWRTEVSAPGATGWQQMVALPAGVAFFSTLTSSSKIQMVFLDAGNNGRKLWERPMGSSDVMHFGSETAVLSDRGEGRLLWLDLATGKVEHEEDDPDSSLVVPVTTEDDLARPAGVFGRLLDPTYGDARIVQINGDRSAKVFDLDSGKLLKSKDGVATTSNEVLAHAGRLFVQDSTSNAQKIFAYQLDQLDLPVTLYTAKADASVSKFAPCGDGRLCFVETDGYDHKKDQVVAVDAVDGGEVWRADVPEIESLAPIGDSVLATTNSSADEVTLLDAEGKKVWTATGRAARLDGGNMLRFADPLTQSVSNRALSGVHLGDGPEAMGEVRDVYTATCSWNTSLLACVGKEQFVLYRFAG